MVALTLTVSAMTALPGAVAARCRNFTERGVPE
jgi:hypothetical protein